MELASLVAGMRNRFVPPPCLALLRVLIGAAQLRVLIGAGPRPLVRGKRICAIRAVWLMAKIARTAVGDLEYVCMRTGMFT